MALTAHAMGAAALFALLILVMFYLGDLMGRISPVLTRALSCALLSAAAVFYTGSRGWHDPKDYLIRLLIMLADHLIICAITDHMFLHRQMIGNYGALLSTMFMALMIPAFFGGNVGIEFLILALLIMTGFLCMVRQIRRKRSFAWIPALLAAGAACLFCRQLLPALMTICIVYLFELFRRPSPGIAAATGCSAAVFAAETALSLTGHIPAAVLARTPDTASLPFLQETVLSGSFLAILAILLLAGTVLCPFIRYFVMNRRIGTTELYPLLYAVTGMALYTFERSGQGAAGIDLRAALYLSSLVPLSAAAFGAMYERSAEDFDLARILAGGDDDADNGTGTGDPEDAAAMNGPDRSKSADKPLSKEDEKLIDSLFRNGSESGNSSDSGTFEFIDPER